MCLVADGGLRWKGGAGRMAHENGGGRYALDAGRTLGQYRVLKPLGKGGMGEVYLVEHDILRTRHALKLLPAERAQTAGFLQRFRDEARVMAQLRHPGIVHVTHADICDGHHYLVMDFVAADSGGTPFDMQEALDAAPECRLDADVAARLAIGICEAVGHAHAQGVVHRDLKPANVLLTSRNLAKAEARVADFGLARLVGEDWLRSVIDVSLRQSMSLGAMPTMAGARDERNSTGAILGTYEYMSPEQRDGGEVDHRSDIYALGVMLYRMVTGRRLSGRAKAASRLVPGLSPDWDTVIDACLEDEPVDRPESLAAVAAALRKASTASRASVSGRPVKAAVPPAVRRDRTAVQNVDMPMRSPKQGDSMAVDLGGGVKLELVWVEPGTFEMGANDGVSVEKPVHRVTLTKGYWMGKYEVTQEQWERVMGSNSSYFKGAQNPVEKVSWADCQKFIQKLNGRAEGSGSTPTGHAYRLPTEAEWEYAARGGAASRGFTYAGGNSLDEVAWYSGNSGSKTHPVGQKKANELGLYDMSGNVWEWCQDWYGDYPSKTATDPTGPASGSLRVRRGGSWISATAGCRGAGRSRLSPSHASLHLGFRVALAPVP
jgi:formylglycine-generating enzyme required for sulfatase activity/tRNA A-37 threonylcarbamoyl transferase component Bud32